MKLQTLITMRRSLRLLATVLLTSACCGQGYGQAHEQGAGPAARFRRARVAPSIAASAHQAAALSVPSYTYSLISYPGTLNTQGVGINPGALGPAAAGGWDHETIAVVGAWYFPGGESQTGFVAGLSETTHVTENYLQINDPHAPTPQQAYSINDLGQIVGDYIDSSNIFHAYELSGDRFKPLEVPFPGATGTFSPAINNSGEIVGGWYDSAGTEHSFTLKDGIYHSFDYPGATSQFYYGINSEGDITGTYTDKSGNSHGFLRKGNTYTSIDFPGATATYAGGINDSGAIVGGYCLTSQCPTTLEGEQGFLFKDGVYTSFAIPGEFLTSLAAINNKGVVMGNYLDAAEVVYTFIATP